MSKKFKHHLYSSRTHRYGALWISLEYTGSLKALWRLGNSEVCMHFGVVLERTNSNIPNLEHPELRIIELPELEFLRTLRL